MARTLSRMVDHFTTEPVRVLAILRLPLIALMGVLVMLWDVNHWLPGLYVVILGVYAVAAVAWLVVIVRGQVPRWASWAPTAVDVLIVVVLCLVSGGATAALLPVFFLLPLSVAFQDRPMLTAVLGITTAIGYLAVWIFYAERDDNVSMPQMVYMNFGFLLWLAVATTALCLQPSSTSRCSARAIPSSCGLPTTAPVSIPRSSTAASPKGISAWHPCWSASTRWAVRWTSAPRLDSERR